jgi:hypothetical protein
MESFKISDGVAGKPPNTLSGYGKIKSNDI